MDRATAMTQQQVIAGKKAAIARKQTVMTTKIAEMEAELAAETDELEIAIAQQETTASTLLIGRTLLARS